MREPNLDLVTKEKGAREMTETLLPCPFCGSEELRISGVMGSYYVKCQECGCEQNMADGFDKAIAAWNRRAQPDVVRCKECKHWGDG